MMVVMTGGIGPMIRRYEDKVTGKSKGKKCSDKGRAVPGSLSAPRRNHGGVRSLVRPELVEGRSPGCQRPFAVRQAHHERFDRLTTNGSTGSPRTVRQAHHERFDRLTTNGSTGSPRTVRQAHHGRFDRLTTNGSTGSPRTVRQAHHGRHSCRENTPSQLRPRVLSETS